MRARAGRSWQGSCSTKSVVNVTYRLADEHGVVLIASARALWERAFDADLGAELLEAMCARELVCASADGDGDIELVVDDSPDLSLDDCETLGTYRLKLRPGDSLLALPSSRLSETVAVGLPWAPGVYEVTVARATDARRIVFAIARTDSEAANEVDAIPGAA